MGVTVLETQVGGGGHTPKGSQSLEGFTGSPAPGGVPYYLRARENL